MQVTLAYPYTDEKGAEHEPDSTVDLDDETAKRLITDGRARLPESTQKKGS